MNPRPASHVPGPRVLPAKAPHPTPTGPDDLQEASALARQELKRRLAEELERSRRYCRALSVFVAAPKPLPNKDASLETVAAATELLARASRAADFVGKLDEHRLLIVMPETDQVEAASAVGRWRNQLWWHSRAEGDQGCRIAHLDFRPGMTAEELLGLADAEVPAEAKTRGELSLADLLSTLGQPAATQPFADYAVVEELPATSHLVAPVTCIPSSPEKDKTVARKQKKTVARDIDTLRDSVRLQRARLRSRRPSAAVRPALGVGMLELMSS